MKLSTSIPHRGAIALFSAGALAGAVVFGAAESVAVTSDSAHSPGGPIGELAAPSPSGFADLAERVQPAVVFITVEKPSSVAAGMPRPPSVRRASPSPGEPMSRRGTPCAAFRT